MFFEKKRLYRFEEKNVALEELLHCSLRSVVGMDNQQHPEENLSGRPAGKAGLLFQPFTLHLSVSQRFESP